MSVLWNYCWPMLATGIAIGAISGLIAFRRPSRAMPLLLGSAAILVAAVAWNGPLGAGDRLKTTVEAEARRVLDQLEMQQIQAALHAGPLSRRLMLSGPADDFQRSELSRILAGLAGVRDASWSRSGGGLPLVVEGTFVAVVGFLIGLLLAYLAELRRRYNSEWTW